ncbi:MAG: hypothetical protein AAGD25_06535 [Cyanobacteria bacterium P01_F01_bin.150]
MTHSQIDSDSLMVNRYIQQLTGGKISNVSCPQMAVHVACKIESLGTFSNPSNGGHHGCTYGEWQEIVANTAIRESFRWLCENNPDDIVWSKTQVETISAQQPDITPTKIQQAVNDAIDAIREDVKCAKLHLSGSINWGDLKCADVIVGRNLDGLSILVFIDEAAPENPEFEQELRQRLTETIPVNYQLTFAFEW